MPHVRQSATPSANMAAIQRASATPVEQASTSSVNMAATQRTMARPSAREVRENAFAQTDCARSRTRARSLVARPLPVSHDVPRASEPGQVVIVTRSFIPDREFGGGFHGDDRPLSTDPDVTARIRAGVLLERGPCGLRGVRAGGRSDESRHDLGHAIGDLFFHGSDVLEPRTATPTIRASARPAGRGTTVRLDYEGSNPLVLGSPDIDVHSRFQVRETERGLEIRATVRGDAFPAAEAFVRDHEGNAVFIGVHRIDIEYDAEGMAMLVGDERRPMMEAQLTILRDPQTQAFVGVEANGTSYSLEDWNARFEGVSGRR